MTEQAGGLVDAPLLQLPAVSADAISSEPPSVDPAEQRARAYYDEFAGRYDDERGGRGCTGYHDLIDDLEMEFLERYAHGKEVLEVGCGTGLLLERMLGFAATARGVDLSERMLERARRRGLDVSCASATALPFADETFDVACSFKVLPHVEAIEQALSEMSRVVRPGGTLVVEFYNPRSLRALVKRLGPSRPISDQTTEAAVHTRYDSPADVRRLLPVGTTIVATRGVRIVTPAAAALRLPLLGGLLQAAERALCDSPAARFGGFWIAAVEKAPSR